MSVFCARGRRRGGVLALMAVLLPGCQSIDGPSPVLIPNRELVVSKSLAIPAEVLALAVNALVVLDPLAPNWRIEQIELGAHRYAFALKRKRFTSGGDGEVTQIFRRRLESLAKEKGYAGYEVVAFTEGIDSSFPIVAQRVSHGVVQFARP